MSFYYQSTIIYFIAFAIYLLIRGQFVESSYTLITRDPIIYLLAFIVVAHLFRAIALWNITVEGIVVPVWASWIVVAIGSFLIFLLYRDF